MIKLAKYLKPYLITISVIFVLVFIQTMTDLALPDYMAKIVNTGIMGGDTNYIIKIGGQMLLVALLGAVCTVFVSYFAAKVSAGFARNMREKVFTRVESFSLIEFDKFSTASLITRTTNDIQQIQMVLFMILRMVLAAPIMGIGGVMKAVGKNPSMSWIIAASVSAIVALIIFMFIFAMPKFKQLQKLVDKINLVTREILTGLRVIRAFNTEKYEEEKFDNANKELTRISLFVNRLMVILNPFMILLLNFTTLAVIWIGAHKIDAGSLDIGNMMAFMQYAVQILFSFIMISMVFIIIPRASVSAGRIAEVIETLPEIVDPKNPETPDEKIKGLVEFKNVKFTYPGADEPVLFDINFTAQPGQTTAIIGSTGSGKSTLINLIPRFYDVTEGEILVDGLDVRKMKQEILRDKIGYVPQKGVLFSGTIKSNIIYGKPEAKEEEVSTAAKTSQSLDFIDEREEKYDAPISQGGTNVSGGQKQRLSIARAIIKKPEICIFDDSFSALDFKTDAALRKALKKETNEATVIIVAQRISTIMRAEKIIVLDEGKIAGIGTHKKLMENCEVYREIALSQLSMKELNVNNKGVAVNE